MANLCSVVMVSIIMWLSPTWPLGQNPYPGAPFIIVNKATNQLAFINNDEVVMQAPVATGKSSELTPEGIFTIPFKIKDPYYQKKNIPGGAKENPLGSRWIGFNARGTEGRTYGIHGTNRPESIGHYVTAGCIRMHEKDVQALYDQVPVGTKVLILKSKDSFHNLGVQYHALSK